MPRHELRRRAPAHLAIALLLASCTGEGDSTPPAPPAIVSVPVSPPPSPPPPPPDSELIATVAPGGQLAGGMACAAGTLRHERQDDGSDRLVAITAVTQVRIEDNRQSIDYRAPANFATDFNGFGGPSFFPEDIRPSAAPAYRYFRKAADEFELYRDAVALEYATLGRSSSPEYLCFFTAGLRSPSAPIHGHTHFHGLADGLWTGRAGSQRLFGSEVTGTLSPATREVQITIDIVGRSQPFGDFRSSSANRLGKATALIAYSGPGMAVAPLTGPGGSTGSITGEFYAEGFGLGFVFELTYPNGDRMFGAVAADVSRPM